MAVPEQSKVNRVFGAGARTLSAFDGLGALSEIVEVAQDCIRLHEVESTKRASIRAYAETEVARIEAAEGVLRSYFEQVFAERRSNFDALFTSLDKALEQGNGEAINSVLLSIVDIAKKSPIAELGDLSQVRALLNDPNKVWEL
jgi:hypothetical protein